MTRSQRVANHGTPSLEGRPDLRDQHLLQRCVVATRRALAVDRGVFSDIYLTARQAASPQAFAHGRDMFR